MNGFIRKTLQQIQLNPCFKETYCRSKKMCFFWLYNVHRAKEETFTCSSGLKKTSSKNLEQCLILIDMHRYFHRRHYNWFPNCQ